MITADSVRRLTVEQDQLPAVSGLAALLQQRTVEEYFAGLWKSRLPAQLLWVVHGPPIHTPAASWRLSLNVSTRKESPSWSWAGEESGRRIVMPKQASARARFHKSSLEGGSFRLHVTGKARILTTGLRALDEYPSVVSGRGSGMRVPSLEHQPDVWAADYSYGLILISREWRKPIVIYIDHEMPATYEDLVCFEINYIGLLLLQPVAGVAKNTFRRIGCAPGHDDAAFFDESSDLPIILV